MRVCLLPMVSLRVYPRGLAIAMAFSTNISTKSKEMGFMRCICGGWPVHNCSLFSRKLNGLLIHSGHESWDEQRPLTRSWRVEVADDAAVLCDQGALDQGGRTRSWREIPRPVICNHDPWPAVTKAAGSSECDATGTITS